MILYPKMTKSFGGFKIEIEPGSIEKAQITVMLG